MTRRRTPQRGGAALYLIVTLLVACGTGVGVYLYLKDHYAHARTAEAAARTTAPASAPPVAVAPEVATDPLPVEPDPPPPAPTPPAPTPSTDPLAIPDELPPEQVEATLAAASARFADCAVLGRVTMTLKIRPSGRVDQVTLDGAESDEMRTCLVSAAKRIKFAKSGKGLTTRYVLAGQ